MYHDEAGEITYSIVVSFNDSLSDVIERYRNICMGIVYVLRIFDLSAVQTCKRCSG